MGHASFSTTEIYLSYSRRRMRRGGWRRRLKVRWPPMKRPYNLGRPSLLFRAWRRRRQTARMVRVESMNRVIP